MRFLPTALKTAVVSAVASATAFASAIAAPVVGGATVVNPTADLGSIQASTLGSATVNSNGFLEFPVTGGNLNGLAGTIEHENSGVSLTDGLSVLDLENFLIDTTTQEILADVTIDGVFVTNTAIFSFDVTRLPDINDLFDLDNPSLELRFTMATVGVLENVFGAMGFDNAVFGLAATAPIVSDVPIPAAFVLFIAGAAGLGFAGRKKTAASA